VAAVCDRLTTPLSESERTGGRNQRVPVPCSGHTCSRARRDCVRRRAACPVRGPRSGKADPEPSVESPASDERLRGFQTSVHAATRWYSWMSPPSRAWRAISPANVDWRRCLGRVEQRECSVRALAVVVGRVDAERPLEVAAAEDQQPVETLGARGPDESFGDGVRLRPPGQAY
jgi:hypothetical protein